MSGADATLTRAVCSVFLLIGPPIAFESVQASGQGGRRAAVRGTCVVIGSVGRDARELTRRHRRAVGCQAAETSGSCFARAQIGCRGRAEVSLGVVGAACGRRDEQRWG